MRVAVFNTKSYDHEFLAAANQNFQHELVFFEPRLSKETTPLAKDFPAVCIFVNDVADAEVIRELADGGVRLIALRCAGFNNVDLKEARRCGLTVVRVPAYSPHAVAEHTVALLLALNRKINRAYARVREGNFALDGLLGFELHGKTVGIIGTGKIGKVVAGIMKGFGCELLAYDPKRNPECEELGARYVSLNELFARSDIITLHCPLLPATHHLIDAGAVAKMKPAVVLINTSRGALIDTQAVIRGLKSSKIGYLGLDVYEEEADLFFEDLSSKVIQDDIFARLLTFPNVVITGHQAYFTRNALQEISESTLTNISEFEKAGSCLNEVRVEAIKA
ncbi:MAG: 2-hydroxyacid dehydrogenase [bacterium]